MRVSPWHGFKREAKSNPFSFKRFALTGPGLFEGPRAVQPHHLASAAAASAPPQAKDSIGTQVRLLAGFAKNHVLGGSLLVYNVESCRKASLASELACILGKAPVSFSMSLCRFSRAGKGWINVLVPVPCT